MKMRIFKTCIAIVLALVITTLGVDCTSSVQHVQIEYNSVEEFIADFGTKIEKENSEDACCLFDDDKIKASTSEKLLCNIEFSTYTLYAVQYRSAFTTRYTFDSFSYKYNLTIKDSMQEEIIIGQILFETGTKRIYADDYNLIKTIDIENVAIEIMYRETKDEKWWLARFNNESFNGIFLRGTSEVLKDKISIDDFIALINPIIVSGYIIK